MAPLPQARPSNKVYVRKLCGVKTLTLTSLSLNVHKFYFMQSSVVISCFSMLIPAERRTRLFWNAESLTVEDPCTSGKGGVGGWGA